MRYSIVSNILLSGIISTAFVSCVLPDVKKKPDNVERKNYVRDSLFLDSTSRQWSYGVDEDEMSPDKIYKASRYTSKEVILDNNNSVAGEIIVRYKAGVNYVTFATGYGNFQVNLYRDTYMRIRLDSAEPVSYKVYTTTKKNADYIFVEQSDTLISLIKKAKRLRFEANLENYEIRIFEFNVSGLKWGYVAKKQLKKANGDVIGKATSGENSSKANDDLFNHIFNHKDSNSHIKVTVTVNSTSSGNGSTKVEVK